MATIPVVRVAIRTASIAGTGLPFARVVFNLARSDIVVGTDGAIVPAGQEIIICDENGDAEPSFFPNALGTNRTQYGIQIYDEQGQQVFPSEEGKYALTSIPNIDGVLLHSILFNVPILTAAESDAYLEAAQLAAGRAEAAEEAASVAAGQAVSSAGVAGDAAGVAFAEAERATQEADRSAEKLQEVTDEGNAQILNVANEGAAQQLALQGYAGQAAGSAALAGQKATDAQTALAGTQALVEDIGDLTTAITGTQTNAAAAAASANAAALSALDAQAGTRDYATLAAALADVTLTAGMRFSVRMQMAGYHGVYQMERTATGHKWLYNRLGGALGSLYLQRRALRGLFVSPSPAGLLSDVWPSDSIEYDGRLLVSRAAASPPTLNYYPLPINPLDEIGTTPAREANTLAVLDPLGTNYATKWTATAQAQADTLYRGSYGLLPYAADVRIRVKTQSISGGTQWRLGETAGTLVTAPVGAWDAAPWEFTKAGYAGATDLAFQSATGNTNGVVASFNMQVYDPLAGESSQLPSDAVELAAQKAGHIKRTFSAPGVFPIDTMIGTTFIDGTLGSALMTVDPAGVSLVDGYTFGEFIDTTEEGASATGHICMGFDRHTGMTNGVSGLTQGQIGVYGNTSSAYRIGKPFANPNISKLAASPTPMRYMVNQGLIHYAMSVKPNGDGTTATQTLWIDAVPYELSTTMPWNTAAPFKAARVQLGAWNNSDEAHKVANAHKGRHAGMYLYARPLSDAEMHQRDRAMIEQIRLDGGREGWRGAWWLMNGDSLTAFSPSWAYHLSDYTGFAIRPHLFNCAVGGSDIGAARADARRLRDLRLITAAKNAGHQRVVAVVRWQTNEILGFDAWSWINNGYSHAIWRDDFVLPLLEEYKAAGCDEIWWVTGPPRLGLGINEAAEVSIDLMLQAAADDFRDNGISQYGFSKIIDLGLGTERMVDWGQFVPETRPGGDPMMNWRCAYAARSGGLAFLAPHATTGPLHLSALAGNAILAEAQPGNFRWEDLYRRVLAGTSPGYGRIIAVSPDGSSATLDTTDVIPAAWPNEPALVTTRDRVLRGGGFNATDFVAGDWSIVPCQEEWQTDGIHESEHGGRRECDRAAPTFKAFMAGLSGTAILR
jgi:hypothetical protein